MPDTAVTAALAEVRDSYLNDDGVLNPFKLSRVAELNSLPDSLTSPGAAWLADIADTVFTDVENGAVLVDDGAEEYARTTAGLQPPVPPHELFAVLVDLAAYTEDLSIHLLSGTVTDMETLAGLALEAVAWRLITALMKELAEAYEEATGADEDDDSDEEN